MRLLSLCLAICYSLSVFGTTAADRFLSTIPATASFVTSHSLLWGANSNNAYVRATAVNTAQAFTNTFTINVWVKGASLSQGVIAMKGDGYQGCASNGYFANVGGKFGLNMSGAINGTTTAFDSTWHMVTAVANANAVTIYVDAVAGGTGTLPGSPADCAAKAFQIGAYSNPNNATDPFVGNLTHMSKWDIALSGAEITALASGGKPANLANHSQVSHLKTWYYLGDGDATGAGNILDHSGNSYNATITGAVTVSTDVP